MSSQEALRTFVTTLNEERSQMLKTYLGLSKLLHISQMKLKELEQSEEQEQLTKLISALSEERTIMLQSYIRIWKLSGDSNITIKKMERSAPAPLQLVTETPSGHFNEGVWMIPIPRDGIFRPHQSSEFFWPAIRARNMVKALDTNCPRQSFDKNIRYLAERLAMRPEELLKMNPVLIGRRLGLSDITMRKFIGYKFNYLAAGNVY